jgi:16S rRNA (guanine527-N7)-methyltransferase
MDAATKLQLKTGARALGVSLDDAQISRLDRLQVLLSTWNTRINLTSVTEAGEVADRHFLDSLAVVPLVAKCQTLVDAGAGAGFPGSVIAIALPELRVTCVESIRKKVAFLQTVRREVAPNLEPICARIEEVDRRFDAAVSRATWDPAEWLPIGARLVAAGGILIAMQGADRPDLAAPPGFDSLAPLPYSIASGSRRLLVYRSTWNAIPAT